MIYVLACDETDAIPFLNGLPEPELERAIIVATKGLSDGLTRAVPDVEIWTTAGHASLRETRSRNSAAHSAIAVVVGPDYGEPSYRRRYIHRRLLAPLVLPAEEHADLIRISAGGMVGSRVPHLRRGALVLRLYPGLVTLGLGFALLHALDLLAVTVTLGRLLPRLLVSERRARSREHAARGTP